jgi:hypothetical protein
MPALHRGPAVVIRPYRPADQPQLRALHDRTPPKGSRATGTQAWFPDLDHITDAYLAFLVAVEEADEGERLIGMVGITLAGPAVPPSVLQAGIGPWLVETTPQQTGAVALFRRMGFQDAGHSMIGRFELVWFALSLDTTD